LRDLAVAAVRVVGAVDCIGDSRALQSLQRARYRMAIREMGMRRTERTMAVMVRWLGLGYCGI
jgi:hypothetical protein